MKAEKTILIEHLLEKVNASPFLFVVDYTGLKVAKFEELRKRLRAAGAEMHVYKNTLVKKAAERAGYPVEIGNVLTGQSAVVTGEKDVCAAAKVMKTFATEFQKPQVKAGVLDGKYLDAAGIQVLADLPSREVLLGTLLGVLQAPASKLVRLLNEPAASLARVLKAKGDQGQEQAA
ncbi:50S ribosomal protein L10 [Verrucomicrobium sp. BvORR106]|uniref:50S ribosomal protein L10 n=1 Tax=Verrucomicrobium sp. BvORR106 TaxID=1403819 RepID=UPI00056E4FFF|nr:50S ribosomal protein L10 [Verrucomicrobium sp. BvORR106]